MRRTKCAMTVQAHGAHLDEVEADMGNGGVESERVGVALNSALPTGIPEEAIYVAAGALVSVVSQVMLGFLNRNRGRRRIVLDTVGPDGRPRRIKLESPKLAELERMLEQTTRVWLAEDQAAEKRRDEREAKD